MSSSSSPAFPHFDQGVADAMMKATEGDRGLPGFLGIKFERFEPGRLLASMEVRKDLLNPFGSMHGGVMAGMIDHCLGCVLYPLMPRGHWAATTEFKLNYLAAVRGGTLEAEATVLSMTKRTAVVRVEVKNEGRLACAAQGTVLLVEPGQR
jgi:1,4-dihydroxy-2-naphthoyl-CoA hydrolase